MPTRYKRKPGVKPRGKWTIEQLNEAITKFQAGEIGLREAERYYGVPARTIKRRIASNNTTSTSLGPSCILGPENEERLVKHINRLCDAGFCPDRTTVRRLAFEFAEALKIDHRFNRETKLAGYDWLWSFLRRNPTLTIRKAEGLSMARGMGLTREATTKFYDILEKELKEYQLEKKPQNIFNVDESGVQLINKVGHVVAKKGAKVVHKITTAEKGETVSLVVCCSAEGRFLPPVIILKGKNLKAEFRDGLPPGSNVFMNPKSAYINTDLFYNWFKDIFIPRKAPGRNILILDGHCSHVSSIALLELADQNDISLICLPPHTTHALQPLDKSFFAPFKAYFKTESNTWVEQNIGRRLTRYQVGNLICKAWNRSASVGNGTIGFKSTGIFPLNRRAIPEHFFSVSDNKAIIEEPSTTPSAEATIPREPCPLKLRPTSSVPTQLQSDPQPSTSQTGSQLQPETPTKILHEISPVPRMKQVKRASKGALLLTSKSNRDSLIENKEKKEQRAKQSENKKRNLFSEIKVPKSCKKSKMETNEVDKLLDMCKECDENYSSTSKKCDWLRCATCKRWLHEDCTIFEEFCVDCGRQNRNKKD